MKCDTRKDSPVAAELAEDARQFGIGQSPTGGPTLGTASASAEDNLSLTATAAAAMRTRNSSAGVWGIHFSIGEAACSALKVEQDRWLVSAIQGAQSSLPGTKQEGRSFLRSPSTSEMRMRRTSTSATAKTSTQHCKENCMNRILNILRSWRLRPSKVNMEVAVQHGGLLRLRPVVLCDRSIDVWHHDHVS